ncbi:MAG: hypothetical protein QOJ85_2162, partial [Solirubrobacteraceae bacterium]|nr:hypothetical protein [Solirubrobacteraceae bacterium]
MRHGGRKPERCRIARFSSAVTLRVLILSWEYPPIVAGGLARHVRKLAEALAAQGV